VALAVALLGAWSATAWTAAAPAPSPAPGPTAGDTELARLRDFLTGPDRTFATRRDAAEVLVEKNTPAAWAVLREVLAAPAVTEATRAVLEVLAASESADPSLVEPLFALLRSEDASARAAAATAFGAYQGDEKVLEGLKALASGATTSVEARLAAVRALAHLFDKRAIAALVALVDDPLPAVASAASAALSELTGLSPAQVPGGWKRWWEARRDEPEARLLARVVRRFRRLLDEQARRLEAVRARLVAQLSDLYDATEVKERGALILKHLADAVPAVRALAARQAARLAASALAASNGSGRRAYQDLLAALLNRIEDPAPEVRAAVAEALAAWGETGAGPALLARLTKETDPAARGAIAAALGKLRVAEAVPVLVRMLDSADPSEVVEAAAALGQIGDRAGGRPDAVKPALGALTRLARTAGPPTVREAACRALARIAPPSAEKVLAAALDDPQPSVRYAAVQGIGNLEKVSAATVSALVARLQDKDAGVRQAAAAALARVGGSKAAAEMAARLKPDVETDPAVRKALWEAVRALADAATGPEMPAALGDLFFARGGPEATEDMQRAAELYQAALAKIPAAQRGGQQAVALYEKLVDAYVAAGTPERAVPTLRQLIVLTPPENRARLRELNRQLGLILLSRSPSADAVPALAAAIQGAEPAVRDAVLDAVRERAETLLKTEAAAEAMDLLSALERAVPGWAGTDAARAESLSDLRRRATQAALSAALAKLAGSDEQAAAATATLKKIGPEAVAPLLDLLESAAKGNQKALEARALAALVAVTGRTDHGYDPKAPLADRLRAIAAWRKGA